MLRKIQIVRLALETVINSLPAVLLVADVLLFVLTQGTVLLPFQDCCE